MSKQKTIFKKYLAVIMISLTLSFIILGITILLFMSRYWRSEKHDLLEENARGIADMVYKNTKISFNGMYIINSALMKGLIDTFSSNINADIFITDLDGNTIVRSLSSNNNLLSNTIPSDIISNVLDGSYEATTDLGGIYKNKCYVVGVPIQMNNIYENKVLGCVFAVSDTKYILEYQHEVIRIILFSCAIALLISFIFTWILSYNIVKPLRQMSMAAKCFGKGDFSKHIQCSGTDEISQLAWALNNMADSLSASETKRRAFISNVSHELKTPMTTISGFIDGILDGTIPIEKQRHYMEIVSSEVKRLSRLVKTMLNLSRIDNKEIIINKQDFDISNIILSVIISFEEQINNKNVSVEGLENSQSIVINADFDMIYQVIYNLIENAVKFVNESGVIDFSILDNNNYCQIVIRNSGIGIPKDEINFVFDKFYKTDKSRSIDKNGLGLGLYITKTIVNLHGGEILADSIEGEYFEIKVLLPKKL